MKKLLTGTAAIALGLAMTAPAHAADGVKLGIGGFMTGYTSWLNQDEDPVAGVAGDDTSVDQFDILRDTEVQFTGETTLDNGLTVGFHTELNDDQADGFGVDESYAFFSGSWGRVNFGAEDGSAYLLQVSAPSADSNIDGLRQYVHGVNYTNMMVAGAAGTDGDQNLDDLFSGLIGANEQLSEGVDGADDINTGAAFAGVFGTANTVFDYDHDVSASDDKITYLTPVFSGFQGGVSYTPNLNANSDGDGTAHPAVLGTAISYDGAWDAAARWEGTFQKLGINFGGGYSHVNLNDDNTALDRVVAYVDDTQSNTNTAADTVYATADDRSVWNVGLDLNWGAFGLGGAAIRDNLGISDGFDRETWVVGADYTTGPYKLGLSYLTEEQEVATQSFDTDRWTAGAIYTYGPGMTFRGSVAWMDYEEDVGDQGTAASDTDASSTNFLLGTEIDF